MPRHGDEIITFDPADLAVAMGTALGTLAATSVGHAMTRVTGHIHDPIVLTLEENDDDSTVDGMSRADLRALITRSARDVIGPATVAAVRNAVMQLTGRID